MIDCNEIIRMYEEDYMTLDEIGEALGCSKQWISKLIKTETNYRFKRLPRIGHRDKRCRDKEQFTEIVKNGKSLSDIADKLGFTTLNRHQVVRKWIKVHELADVFEEHYTQDGKPKRGSGVGGVDGAGYVRIRKDLVGYNKINPTFRDKTVYLHKVMVEYGLLKGHLLPKPYCVHHVDENKTNNHLSNLVILTMSQHRKLHIELEKGRALLKGTTCTRDEWEAGTIKIEQAMQRYHQANLATLRQDIELQEFDPWFFPEDISEWEAFSQMLPEAVLDGSFLE
mgnify:CR=1 FL=1